MNKLIILRHLYCDFGICVRLIAPMFPLQIWGWGESDQQHEWHPSINLAPFVFLLGKTTDFMS